MIAYLRGVIAEKTSNGVLLDVGGIGYFVYLSGSSLEKMPSVGSEVKMHTHLHVREDSFQLYGFATKAEKSLFELIIGVSGMGPKVAMSILSAYEVDALRRAIASEDIEAISAIPGIGKKSAQRLILELKEKISAGDISILGKAAADGAAVAEAHDALVALGYSSAEARAALEKYLDGGPSENIAVEDLVKCALQRLAPR